MTTGNDERMDALKKIEKENMAKSTSGLELDGSTFVFRDTSYSSPLWDGLNRLLDELADFRAETWIANHSKEKSR